MSSKFVLLTCLLAVAHASGPQLGLRVPDFQDAVVSRVVGGSDADPGEFPHQVSLQWGLPPVIPLSHICGGSILNERWILTAAHCPKAVPFGSFTVKAGKHMINSREKSEQIVTVQKTFVHEQYPGNVAPYDIALLKLKSPLIFNKNVRPIKLPKPDSVPVGNSTLSGWGSVSTSAMPIMPNTLQKANLPLVNLTICKKAIEDIAGPSPLHKTNVCTGPLTGGYSACSGDSGGPLIQVNNEGEPELIGVVSWGIIPCGTTGAPSIYTRVSAYNDWIQEIVTANT